MKQHSLYILFSDTPEWCSGLSVLTSLAVQSVRVCGARKSLTLCLPAFPARPSDLEIMTV